MTPLERHLRKWMEKAVVDYGMIRPGDRVAVGISGGGDSTVLSFLLQGPFVSMTGDFEVEFIHVDPGFPGSKAEQVKEWVAALGGRCHLVETEVYDEKKDGAKRPCFICSRRRRKAIIEKADELGCNRIAFGHNRNDVVESYLMNIFYNGETSCMMPAQELFSGKFQLVRPMYYVRGHLIKRFAKQSGFPNLEPACPYEDDSKRELVRGVIKQLEKERPHVADNIFLSQFKVLKDYMPEMPDGKNPPDTPPRI
ncbi:MAG TPA: ATP-binding protein [bacterium]|nr:ATP-binding protein [bacterium]